MCYGNWKCFTQLLSIIKYYMFTITICCCTHHLPVISIKNHISFYHFTHIEVKVRQNAHAIRRKNDTESHVWCIAVSKYHLCTLIISFSLFVVHQIRKQFQTKRNLKMNWLKCHIYPAASDHSWSNGNSIKCIYVYHRYHIFLCNKNKFSVFPTPVFRHDHV